MLESEEAMVIATLLRNIRTMANSIYPEGPTTSHGPEIMLFSYLSKLGFMLLVFPFHTKVKDSIGLGVEIRVRGYRVQKVLCFLVHLGASTVICLSFVRSFRATNIKAKPSSIFPVFLMVTRCMFSLTFYFTLWFRRAQIVKMLQELGKHPIPRFRRKHVAAVLLVFLAQLTVQSIVIIFSRGNITKGGQSLPSWLSYRLWVTRSMFFLPANNDTNIENVSATESVFLGFMFINTVHFTSLHAFFAAISVFGAMLAHRIADECSASVQPTVKLQLQIQAYLESKRKMQLVNEAFSLMYVVTLCSLIVYAAEAVGQPSKFKTSVYTAANLVTYAIHTAVFIIAAEAQSKMSSLPKSIITTSLHAQTLLRPSDLQVVLNGEGDVGIRGWKFFTVSYPFLGSVITICMTYGLVVLQLGVGQPEKDKLCQCGNVLASG